MTVPLVMFGEDWGGLPSSTQHLAKRLVRTRPVIWVNSIGLRRPRLNARDIGRLARKATAMFGRSPSPLKVKRATVPDGLTVVQPHAVSWPGNPLASEINRRLLGRQLRAVLRDLGLERPVLWSSLPTAVDVVGELEESAVVYYCCDDFDSLAGVDHGPVSRAEARLVEHADLVMTTNPSLQAKLFDGRALRARHLAVPHGVDADLFSAPADRPIDLPEGKVALFYGSLSSWLDLEMLRDLAGLRPDWRFVLIGSPQTDLSPIAASPNIILLGPKAHDRLPGYVQHADAALLPFRDIPQIRACNPLKLREYLASGTPVVTTDFPAISPYRDLLHVAPDAAGFADALMRLDNTSEVRKRRHDRVALETWDARADDALRAIDAVVRS